jgi:hypothetical protein
VFPFSIHLFIVVLCPGDGVGEVGEGGGGIMCQEKQWVQSIVHVEKGHSGNATHKKKEIKTGQQSEF